MGRVNDVPKTSDYFEVSPPHHSRLVNQKLPLPALAQVLSKRCEELKGATERNECLGIEKTVGAIDETDVSNLGSLVIQMEVLRSPYYQFYKLLLERLKELC